MTTAFGKEPLSVRGRWIVIIVATVVLQFSYWLAVVSVWADPGEELVTAGMLLGLAAVPFVFMLLAFASRHPRAPWAVVRAMALFVIVGIPLGILHIASGVAAGYAAGGIAALRGPEGVRHAAARIAMVVAVSFSITIILAVAPGPGLVLGALLPFPALGLADWVAARHHNGVA